MTTQPPSGNHAATSVNGWPDRPVGEVFPELLDSICVAQLLLYDRRGQTPEQGRRNVRELVKTAGLPTYGRFGKAIMFHKSAILEWIRAQGGGVDNNPVEATVAGA